LYRVASRWDVIGPLPIGGGSKLSVVLKGGLVSVMGGVEKAARRARLAAIGDGEKG